MSDDCRLHQPMGTQNRKQHIRLHFTRMPGDAGTDNLRPERGGQNDHVCLCGCHFSGRKWSSGCNGRCRKRMGIVMRVLIILFFFFVCGSVFLGCKSGKHLTSDSHTQIIVHDKLVPVFRPADSASIRALLECDSNGRVVLSWLDMAQSENARLRFKLDSMGNLMADFKVPSDTVFIPGKDSTIIQKSVQTIEIERRLTPWQKFCMVFTIVVLILFVLFAVYKIRVILNKK